MAQSSVISAICGAKTRVLGIILGYIWIFGVDLRLLVVVVVVVVVLEEVILAHNSMAKNEHTVGIRVSKNEVFEAILLGGLRTEFPRFLGPAYYQRKC